MYKAAVNIKLSPDYWEALMANPDSDRQAAVSKTMESVGGKLHFFGFTMGNGMHSLPEKLLQKKHSCPH